LNHVKSKEDYKDELSIYNKVMDVLHSRKYIGILENGIKDLLALLKNKK
jgi:hypothetical protein